MFWPWTPILQQTQKDYVMLFVLFGSLFISHLEHTSNMSTVLQFAVKTYCCMSFGQQYEFLTSRTYDDNDGVQAMIQIR